MAKKLKHSIKETIYQDDVDVAKKRTENNSKVAKVRGSGESEIYFIIIKDKVKTGGEDAWKLT